MSSPEKSAVEIAAKLVEIADWIGHVQRQHAPDKPNNFDQTTAAENQKTLCPRTQNLNMKIEPIPEGTGALIARMAADDRKAASERATPETAGSVPVVAAVATGSSLLFPLAEIASKSPRLLWLESHGIRTLYRDDLPAKAGRWEAFVGDYEKAVEETLLSTHTDFYTYESHFLAWGETEEDAILALAENNGWPLWQNSD